MIFYNDGLERGSAKYGEKKNSPSLAEMKKRMKDLNNLWGRNDRELDTYSMSPEKKKRLEAETKAALKEFDELADKVEALEKSK